MQIQTDTTRFGPSRPWLAPRAATGAPQDSFRPASALFSAEAPRVHRHAESDLFQSSPFSAADGAVEILGVSGLHRVDPDKLEQEPLQEYPGGRFLGGRRSAWQADGSCFLVTEGALVRLTRAGMESFPVPSLVTTPLSPTPDGGVAFGIPAGVEVRRPDGTVRSQFELPWPEQGDLSNPSQLTTGPDGSLYVLSDDHQFFRYSPDGDLQWQVQGYGGLCAFAPQPSPDGSSLVVAGNARSLKAVRCQDGETLWTCRLPGALCSQPVSDQQGNLLVLVRGDEDGQLIRVGPGGELLGAVGANLPLKRGLHFEPQLSVAPDGQILMLTSPEDFLVLDSGGACTLRLGAQELFEGEEFIGFTLVNQGQDCLLTGKTRRVARFTLPTPLSEELDYLLHSPGAAIREQGDGIRIGGVQIRRRSIR